MADRWTPDVGDKVKLNKRGEALFKRPIRGVVEQIDPLDETAVKVRISAPLGDKGDLRTISLRDLCTNTDP